MIMHTKQTLAKAKLICNLNKMKITNKYLDKSYIEAYYEVSVDWANELKQAVKDGKDTVSLYEYIKIREQLHSEFTEAAKKLTGKLTERELVNLAEIV